MSESEKKEEQEDTEGQAFRVADAGEDGEDDTEGHSISGVVGASWNDPENR